MRNEFILDYTLRISIRYRTLESIAYSDEDLAVRITSLRLHKKDDTIIELGRTDLPLKTDSCGIFRCGITFKILYGNDRYLIGCAVIKSDKDPLQSLSL